MALDPQQLVPIAEAKRRVLGTVTPLGAERVAIADALDRVVIEDVLATGDVPPFPSSAMDGYAVRSGGAPRTLALVGESRAGAPSASALEEGGAIRISTGAAVPAGADAVIRQEDVAAKNGTVELLAPVRAGQNIRGPGEDMRAGAVVLTAPAKVGPAQLAAAVAAGHGALTCARRPRVSVLCTGDELREPGEPLRPGEIHNSNAPMLTALVTRCGAAPTSALRLPDDRAETETSLAQALAASDVVVISGGVSVGPHDHVKPALAALGVQERFWRVALQPGKPTWFGTTGTTLVFGLPGNPVSSYVTFVLFVAPALAALQGLSGVGPRACARLGAAVRRSAEREQAVRVRFTAERTVVPSGGQGSHMLSSLLGAEALALIPAGDGEQAAGTEVELEALPG